MMAPTAFTFNEQAAQDNSFMTATEKSGAVTQRVLQEYATFYQQLTEVHGVKVGRRARLQLLRVCSCCSVCAARASSVMQCTLCQSCCRSGVVPAPKQRSNCLTVLPLLPLPLCRRCTCGSTACSTTPQTRASLTTGSQRTTRGRAATAVAARWCCTP